MNAVKVRELGTDLSGHPVWLCRPSFAGCSPSQWSIDYSGAIVMFEREHQAVAFGTARLQQHSNPPLMCCEAYLRLPIGDAKGERAPSLAEQIKGR